MSNDVNAVVVAPNNKRAMSAGVDPGPSEGAAIRAAQGASLELLHLVVPRIPA